MIQFGNRQCYVHGNPMREYIDVIKKELKEIKSELRHIKKNRLEPKRKIRRNEK